MVTSSEALDKSPKNTIGGVFAGAGADHLMGGSEGAKAYAVDGNGIAKYQETDILKMVPVDAKRAGLKDKFVEELNEACGDKPRMVLADAVDEADKESFEDDD